MAIQTLRCRPGNHVWRRESQRGKPPQACAEHKGQAVVIESVSTDDSVEVESIGPAISGKALADRIMFNLESRGQTLAQAERRGYIYAGPRY